MPVNAMHSTWRDPRIQPYELAKLTPMSLHSDERWKTRDLPRIEKDGLWYPIALYKVTLDWWNTKFVKWRPLSCRYVDPIVNEDGFIWAIKVGSNRYQCAEYLGYSAIDAIMFSHSDDCAKFAIWIQETDPLNTAAPYQGLWSYT